MEAAIIVTYRCNARCRMCHTWQFPTRPEEEFAPRLLEKIPALSFCNITGGEPFIREDIGEIVAILKKRTKRIVISTNGYLTERIINLAKEHKDIGFRISLEGLPAVNDELRGLKDGFNHGLKTLLELQRMGRRDIGVGITVSDQNFGDLPELYQLTRKMRVEFATAAVHNSYYFHKDDNRIKKRGEAIKSFAELTRELLGSSKPKDWFRAYFNYGLINYIRGGRRLLPCGAGTSTFFLDPWGEIRPCNGMRSDSRDNSFGNLHEKSFAEIWYGDKAQEIRRRVKVCNRQCWMIGTAAPAMKQRPWKPVFWVIKNKFSNKKLG
ncbi:MAG: radical SAM protein [Candidatus Ratteibacteria bacterium]